MEQQYDNLIQTLGELILYDFFLNVDPDESFYDLLPLYQYVSSEFDIDLYHVVKEAKDRARDVFIVLHKEIDDINAAAAQFIEYVEEKHSEASLTLH